MNRDIDLAVAASPAFGGTSMMPRKMAFIVDVRGWAFDTIARSMQARLAPLMDVCEVIYWEDFDDPVLFIKHINKRNLDLVHFFFREHLNVILKTGVWQSDSFLRFCRHVFTTHVPDYLHSNSIEMVSQAALFDFVDGYFTTCQDLFDLYTSEPLVRNPDDIIFDWPAIAAPLSCQAKSARKGGLRVLWSGNSKWGEHIGFMDYKGLATVIRSAVKQVQARFPDIEFVCFDSAEKRVPHETILTELEKADVLLIASEKEGTPLTLIEAMSRACAVVTTPVGIATEVLPEEQQPLICPRNAESFAQALIYLYEHPQQLRRIQQANRQAYQINFGPTSPLMGKWMDFLNTAYERHKRQGLARRNAIIKATAGSAARRLLITILRPNVRLVKRFGLVKPLNSLSPRFSEFYNKILRGENRQDAPNYQRIGLFYHEKIQNSLPEGFLVIYAPMWKGVAASTESIFGANTLRFPYSDLEYPEVESHPYLDNLAMLLAETLQVPLVYSGGSILHLALAQRVHQLNPDIRQFFMWHGSPAQWVDAGQAKHFQMWNAAHRDGIIKGMVTVKPGLHLTMRRIGIKAWDIFNPIPELPFANPRSRLEDSVIRIGLFSAISHWYKNPHVQLLAVAGRPKVILDTNLHANEVCHLNLGIKAVKHYQHMSRPSFLRLIAQQDINLYVTNTECSPMIALESWALGVPCIVGPAGDVYSAVSLRLAELLVEPEVDNPTAISARIDRVLSHHAEITGLLSQHRQDYNMLYVKKKMQLVEGLCKK